VDGQAMKRCLQGAASNLATKVSL